MAFLVVLAVAVVVIVLVMRAAATSGGAPRSPRGARPARPVKRSRPRPLAPDDDPDFLRELSRRTRRDDGTTT